MMADTPTNTSAHVPPASTSGAGGNGDPSVIPQWKKELIQRRKNLAKTIGAVATQVHDSASTVAAAISASASSPVTPHPRTPTGGGAFPVGSPFYAGAGTKEGSTSTNTNTNNNSPLDTVPDSERQHPGVENKENNSPSLLLGTDSSDKTDSLPTVGEGGEGDVMTREDEGKVVIARDNNPQCSSIPSKAATSPTVGVHFGAHFGGANEQQQHQQQHHHYHSQQQQQRSSVGGSVRAGEAVLVPPPPTSPLAASGSSSSSSSSGGGSVSAGAANGPQSHSNAGSEHSGSSSSSCSSGSSTVAAAIATATSSSRPNSVVIVDREIPSVSSNNNNGGVAGKGSSPVLSPGQQTQQQQQREGGAGVVRKMVAATAAEEIVVVYEKNNSVLGGGPVVDVTGGGGVGGGGGPGFGDAGEELKYGPGIVSRLRCRYLSLALRQSVTKQRPSLNSMRRATSLNNLLDEESEDLSEREQSIGSEGGGQHQNHHNPHHHQHHQQPNQQQQKKYHSQNYHYQQQQQQQREHYANGNGNNHNHNHNHLHQKEQQQQALHATVVLQPPYQKQQPQFAPKQPWIHQQQQQQEEQQVVVKTAAPFLRGVQNSYTRASRQVEKKNEYNRYTKHHRGGGGADAVLLKRARSVEALVRYDHHKAWERDATTGSPPAAAAALAVVPAGGVVAAAVEAVAGGVSSSEVGSNVIILDEIATPTTTATNNGGGGVAVASATTTLESNGISSSGPGSGAPMAATAPTTMMMNGGGAGVVGTRGVGGGGAGTDLPLLVSDCVTIEEKIINGREKGDPKPKRLTSIIDADERPPPDVVKQTMKIFEANANRRGGRANGAGGAAGGPPGSDVASKVANYRSIIISGSATTTAAPAVAAEKPPITHPKPPLSPKKPNIKPRTASPKHQAPAPATTTTVGKPPPSPKSLEAVNNLKNASGNSNGTSIVATGQRNNKPSATVAESLGGTPPSPPARSKHASMTSNGVGAPAPGSVGAVNKNSMQSNGGGSNNEMLGGEVTTHSAECTPDEGTLEAKNNALKNGGAAGGGVRDHHHNNYENGLTQTAATAAVVAASKTSTGSDSGHQHMHNAAAASSNTAQGAAASSLSSSPSPAGGICESPSIQQLTSKLASLHLATSTPTGAAGANGTTNPLDNAADRRNLEYVTSDEEEEDDDDDDEHDGGHHHSASYTVNPDSGSEEDRHPKGANNDADDDGDDEREEAEGNSDDDDVDAGDDRMVRKISRTAMENIARAGTTTQFRFNGTVKSSYLPGVGGGGVTLAAPSTKPPAPPIPMSRESLGPAKSSVNGVATAAAAGNNEANGSAGRSPSEVAAGSVGSNSGAVNNGSVGGAHNDGVVAGGGSPLTRREIEKNQINREKSGEVTASAVSGTTGNSGAGVGASPVVGGGSVGGGVANASVQKLPTGSNNSNGSSNSVDSTKSFVAKWGTGGGQSVASAAATGSSTAASPLAGLVAARKKAKPPPSQQDGTNTMVFNFSDRKDVPDYIENDGVIIRPRPRELPKPGESGFVVLGDLTLETSTDPDEAFDMGPPSPCNGEFANAYIVINGKSSMRNKTSRSNKFKIQFDDSLTSTYEYPSETSLLEPTNGLDVSDGGPDTGLVPPPFATDNGLLSHTNKLLSSVPLGSAPFASYTPVKAAIDTTFELGVTRTPSPSAASTASSNGSHSSSSSSSSSSNSHHQSATSHSANNDLQQHQQHQQQQQHSVANGHRHQLIDRPNGGLHTVASNGHSNGADTTLLLNGLDGTGLNGTGEPESIQYLKPASDEQTVNWSQGTRVTDLLF